MRGAVHRFLARWNGRTVESEALADGRIHVDGHPAPLEVRTSGPGRFRITLDGRTMRAHVAAADGIRWVFVEGWWFAVELKPHETAERPAPPVDESLAAPMPATVVRIVVAPGQAVQTGETLLVLEAMKMNLPVRAPRDGRVRAVHCREGDLVEPGVRLVELE